MATKPNSKPLAILTVGYQKIVIPMEQALKVMQLLQGAQKLDWHRENVNQWVLEGELNIAISSLKPEQIIMPEGQFYPAPGSPQGSTRHERAAIRGVRGIAVLEAPEKKGS